MSEQAMPQVKFVKQKKTIEVQPGENLRSAALQNGIEIYQGPHKLINCRGLGQCGSCNVAITKGAENCSAKGPWEKFRMLVGPLLFWMTLGRKSEEFRLSCRTRVNGDIEVETNPPNNWHGEKFWN